MQKSFGPSNIKVNAIAPGDINTDMNSGFTKEELKEIENEIPLGRIGEPEDVANCLKMLIENKYITGQVITIDGRMDHIKYQKQK